MGNIGERQRKAETRKIRGGRGGGGGGALREEETERQREKMGGVGSRLKTFFSKGMH